MSTSTSIDGDLLDRLEKLFLDHRGKENAISSSEISEVLTINDRSGKPKTREAIRTLVDERKIPIAAGPHGYYLISSTQELEDYVERLQSRAQGTIDRAQMTQDAWEAHLEYLARQKDGDQQ